MSPTNADRHQHDGNKRLALVGALVLGCAAYEYSQATLGGEPQVRMGVSHVHLVYIGLTVRIVSTP